MVLSGQCTDGEVKRGGRLRVNASVFADCNGQLPDGPGFEIVNGGPSAYRRYDLIFFSIHRLACYASQNDDDIVRPSPAFPIGVLTCPQFRLQHPPVQSPQNPLCHKQADACIPISADHLELLRSCPNDGIGVSEEARFKVTLPQEACLGGNVCHQHCADQKRSTACIVDRQNPTHGCLRLPSTA